jgi:sarcosine oxidase subunit beta
MSSVGFGLSPASGKAVSELVLHGECRFCDLTALRLGRFAGTPADWRDRLGWTAQPELPTGVRL